MGNNTDRKKPMYPAGAIIGSRVGGYRWASLRETLSWELELWEQV